MNDHQLEWCSSDHHLSPFLVDPCEFSDGNSRRPPTRSPSWISCWARCPNVPGQGSCSRSAWLSMAQHGSATLEIFGDTLDIFGLLQILWNYLEVICGRSVSVPLPLHPPCGPLGTCTNVKLPPYLHRMGGSCSDHHCFVFLRSGQGSTSPRHPTTWFIFWDLFWDI